MSSKGKTIKLFDGIKKLFGTSKLVNETIYLLVTCVVSLSFRLGEHKTCHETKILRFFARHVWLYNSL